VPRPGPSPRDQFPLRSEERHYAVTAPGGGGLGWKNVSAPGGVIYEDDEILSGPTIPPGLTIDPNIPAGIATVVTDGGPPDDA
jgi:hypothetical protein